MAAFVVSAFAVVVLAAAIGGWVVSGDRGNDGSVVPVPVTTMPSAPADDATGRGEPADLPGLIAVVTPSTFMIECSQGQGSGFVLDTTGLTSSPGRVLVTNQHVIEGCEEQGALTVSTDSGQFQGSVIATDSVQDLAVIDVPGLGAPALRLAMEPVVGQWVMAVGSPLGYRDSVAPGIVTNVASDERMLTTNVALGPGNSGGPLVDNQGRVVAVNFAVWEDAEMIGLAREVEALCERLLDCL